MEKTKSGVFCVKQQTVIMAGLLGKKYQKTPSPCS